MKKRLFAGVLTAFVLTSFCLTGAGCSQFGDGTTVDSTKTQITVSNYDGGIGTDWLYAAAARFEELYADYSFEDDKTGVQVSIVEEETKGSAFQINASGSHVIFMEEVPINSWSDYFEDITAIVTETLPSQYFSDGESIEDKLGEEAKSMLGLGEDDKYYLLPHYEAFRGVQYDVTYFNDNNLFISATGGWTNLEGDLSDGPDGKTGVIDGVDYSLDDGLPASFEEFVELMDRIASANIGGAPLLWAGANANSYFNMLVDAFANAYMGKEDIELIYTFDSEGRNVEVITEFDSDGDPIVEEQPITESTGYLVYQMAGRYYALQMAKTILSNTSTYAHAASLELSTTNTAAQDIFILDKDEGASFPGYKDAAMLIEGNYWANEAKNTIESHDATYGERQFSWMPLPTILTGDADDVPDDATQTMRDTLYSYGFVKAGITNEGVKNAAKKFLQFCYSDSELRAFTVETGMTRNLDYDLSDEEFESLNSYAQSVWQYREQSEIAQIRDMSNIYLANENSLTAYIWSSTLDTGTVQYPYNSMISGISARDYFEGMWVSATDWENNNRQYYTDGD